MLRKCRLVTFVRSRNREPRWRNLDTFIAQLRCSRRCAQETTPTSCRIAVVETKRSWREERSYRRSGGYHYMSGSSATHRLRFSWSGQEREGFADSGRLWESACSSAESVV